MPQARDIMKRAGVLLHDTEHVRWPLSELADWINEAVRAIILAKPSAHSMSRVVTLVEGTLQKVPTDAGAEDPEPLTLVRLVRNMKGVGSNADGGKIITAVARDLLDAQEPYWHDRNHWPWRKDARHYVYDEANPLEFYIFPGNDGSGLVEMVLATCPKPIAVPGEPDDVDAWTSPIGLPEPYSVPMLDYVLFRAHSKDDEAGAPGRAMSHYQLFASAIGLKIQVEGATSPNARR